MEPKKRVSGRVQPVYAGIQPNGVRAVAYRRSASNMVPSTVIPSRLGLSTAELANELGIDRASSELVAIDHAQLDRMAGHIGSQLDVARFSRARWDDPLFWNVEDSDEDRSQYFAIGCAINFRFWALRDHQLVPAAGFIDGEHYRGAMYMWRCLRRALDRRVLDLLDAKVLADLTEEDFDAIFTDDNGINPLAIARTDRLANLRDLGERLRSDWDGAFYNLVASCRGSLATFARLSRDFRAFDDPVYKLTMVNGILHLGSGVYEFVDEPLPAIDYHLLRQALRQGILRPSAPLAAKLTQMSALDQDEAQELRRVALAAFVELAAKSAISGELLDNRYWMNRVNCADVPVCLDPETAAACPFLGACERATQFALPIELTRYY